MAAEGGARPPAALDGGPVGLPSLPRWLALSADAARARPSAPAGDLVPRLLAFAAEAREPKEEPLARAALSAASRLARSREERRAVREALEKGAGPGPTAPGALVARGLALARVAETPGEARAARLALARDVPDAPERAPDLFLEGERDAFEAAVRTGAPQVRLARAEALVRRRADEAAALVKGIGPPPTAAFRNRLATLLLAAGHARAAREALDSRVAGTETERLRASRLDLAVELRLARATPPPQVRHRGRRPPAQPLVARVGDPRAAQALDSLAPRVAAALAAPEDPEGVRLLRTEVARAALAARRYPEALQQVAVLSATDPSTTLGAEEILRDAFALYLRRDAPNLAEATRLWDLAAATYRPPALRRRAIYWSARGRMASGDQAGARLLLVSLVPGTAPDLVAFWAARSLGVPLPEPAPPSCDAGRSPHELPVDRPGLPSRELLAAGLPRAAEDAAELEGSGEPILSAACAAERSEHGRAVALLKGRWPELGTPEEASAPPRARALYYPRTHTAVVEREAAAQGLPPALLFGLIRQESIFQPRIRSRSGALGLMQVMPATGRGLYRRERRRGRPDLTDPSENVRLGAQFIAEMLRMFDGDKVTAVAAYNAGPGRLARWKREAGPLDEPEFAEWMPLSEPRDYVRRVLFYEAVYASLPAPGVPRVTGLAVAAPRP